MRRFFRNLFKHPGTWTFLSLLSVGIAIAVPPAAPILVPVAAACIGAATITSGHFFWTNKVTVDDKDLPDRYKTAERLHRFFKNHPIQLTIAILAFGLFITALVLTIGFFTGGAGFVFMAPVFAALAAPFAAAAASAGIQLALAGLAGTAFVLASINIPNTLKRFSAWLDGFIYDGAAARTQGGKAKAPEGVKIRNNWEIDRYTLANEMVSDDEGKFSFVNYLSLFADGVKGTVTNDKGFFTSPDAELLEPPLEPKVRII